MKVIYVISELFKLYDHDYSLEHCTEFEPNRNYGDFFKNLIMVMSTEKKLLDNYIAFYTGDCIHKLESLIEKIKVTIKKIKKKLIFFEKKFSKMKTFEKNLDIYNKENIFKRQKNYETI